MISMSMLGLIVTIICTLITALFGPLIVERAKTKWFNKNDAVAEAITINEKIDQQLDIIMNELGCDRICLTQFHNGGNFFPTGKSIKKFSIFYEKTTNNTLSVKETFQNIPVSLYPRIFSHLYKEGELVIPDCSNNKIDCGIFDNVGKNYNTKSFYMIAIRDIDNNFIGTLTISFYGEKYKFELEDWIYLRERIGVLGYMLSSYLK